MGEKCNWSLPKKIVSVTKLSPYCAIYDGFGSRLTSFEQSAVAYVKFTTADNITLNISGATSPTFENGYAKFGIYLTPLGKWEYTHFETKVSLTLSTNINKTFLSQQTITYKNIVWKVPESITALVGILGATIFLSVICCALLMWYYSRQPIIRAATITFLVVILLGSLIMGAFVVIAPLTPQYLNCVTQMWVLHFGFAAKQKLQKINWTTTRLSIYFLGIPVICLFVYLILWTLLGQWKTEFLVANDGLVYKECRYNSTFTIISLISAIIFLLWIVQLAVSVRGVPKNFNESRWLGASVYTISIVFLFVIPLGLIHSVSFIARRIFVSVGCWIATQSVLFFLFGIKFIQIWTGKATKPAKDPHHDSSIKVCCVFYLFQKKKQQFVCVGLVFE
ncbi:hypothetical protein RFI_07098 [Reticulomyxa filosa]|uniref:G-protein coupled receptors family 3 profile domain-containing protein n=1 Tax=Reticulomyxa filosa TaxID=46433 RepID=X6NXM3_RETFI|nr:hypothetical protein RFI_07098 [Reticulomyxa filosa]|eukprot:ETO30022.1 hypothetical protein RFI_07098 [Reticulomyxa filosa]